MTQRTQTTLRGRQCKLEAVTTDRLCIQHHRAKQTASRARKRDERANHHIELLALLVTLSRAGVHPTLRPRVQRAIERGRELLP